MSADEFAPALTDGTEDYSDSFHRSLDAALAKPAPAETPGPDGDGIAAGVGGGLAEVSALVGDDIGAWMNNPFMTPDLLAEKVCWWIAEAVATARTEERERIAREIEGMELVRVVERPGHGGYERFDRHAADMRAQAAQIARGAS